MNLSEKANDKLLKVLEKAKKIYNSKGLASEISELRNKASNIIYDDLQKQGQDLSNFQDIRFVYKNPIIIDICKLIVAREKEQGNMTAGELINHLSKFDKDRIVKIFIHVSCMTDSGTDMGGMEAHKIADITDLETRIEITATPDY